MLLNKKGYMDNETWVQVVQAMSPGIYKMPVIRDHPNWSALLTFDSFKLHVNVGKTLDYWSKKTWVTSFKSANLHPKHWISFEA